MHGITPTVPHADHIGSRLDVLCEDDRAIVHAASAASKAAEFLLASRPQTGATETSGTAEDCEAVRRLGMREPTALGRIAGNAVRR
jgi:antirestriction protein ArdC